MLSVAVRVSSISAERLSENIPQSVQFQMNLSIPSAPPQESENNIIIPFIFTISSIPPIVQISIKGTAIVSSSTRSDLDKVSAEIKGKRIPAFIVNAVFSNMIAESIILCRSLGVPPPIPPLPLHQLWLKKSTNTAYSPIQ